MTPVHPKVILKQRYGAKALYRTEAVPEVPQDNSPKLLIPQQKQNNKFRCCLELPEFSVISDVFSRKKDAEQAAAKIAIEKLGIKPSADALQNKPLTEEEKWQALIERLSLTFSDQYVLSYHPLIAHFKAAVQREGVSFGMVPAAVVAAMDTRVATLCKSIDSRVETTPALALELVLKAAGACGYVHSPKDSRWIGRREPFSIETIERLVTWTPETETQQVLLDAVYIPCSSEKQAEPLTLKIEPHEYYVDVIACHLRVLDSSHVLISRTVSKAPSETRLYSPLPGSLPSIPCLPGNGPFSENHVATPRYDLTFNRRASTLICQKIYGDAILAAIGSTFKSMGNLSWESIALSTYHRLLLSRFPRGNYKISRDAILMAELPTAFTTRSQWRGAVPRDLLTGFCHHYRLSEPVFSLSMDNSTWTLGISKADLKAKPQISEHRKQADVGYSNGKGNESGMINKDKNEKCERLDDMPEAESDKELTGKGTFRCAVKIVSKTGGLIIECVSDPYRNQSDAYHSAALKALVLLSEGDEKTDLHPEHSICHGTGSSFTCDPVTVEINDLISLRTLMKGLGLFDSPSVAFVNFHQSCSPETYMFSSAQSKVPGMSIHRDEINGEQNHDRVFLNIEGPDSGKSPAIGTTICIRYSVCLLGQSVRECLESRDEFEFEFGTSSVIPQLEACVTRMSIDQTVFFYAPLPSKSLILAAAGINAPKISTLSLEASVLEYTITLLRLIEPLEERMEQAFFHPPLSKQRVEYALHLVVESQAQSLVDLGCGSGSLFEGLLEQKTDLVHIAGVDISQRSLIRAAKILHSKLGMNSKSNSTTASFQSAFLYEGSITEYDQRIHGFDIATCIEVIEHMEEDQAYKFGECALGTLCPRVLLVSTPNFEYNPILQRSTSEKKMNHEEDLSEDAKGKIADLPCKFRNDDHKFEWTRRQFSDWALKLASKYGYSVEFSGVGGSGDIEPGFASQIAVFKRCPASDGSLINARKCMGCREGYTESNVSDLSNPYQEIWKWNAD